jgi:PAS domain S-box-containing protein
MKFTPFRIALIYFVFALLWITTTDSILDLLVEDTALLTFLQTVKGIFYISMTAIALFLMIKSHERSVTLKDSKLRKNENWVTLTTETSGIGKWEWLLQKDEIILDEVTAKLIGYSLNDLEPVTTNSWKSLMHPEDVSFCKDAVKEHLSGDKEIYECEFRILHKDGRWRYILSRGRAIEWDQNGRVTRLVGTHIDITDRKSEEEVRAYQASLLSHVSDAVLSLDRDMHVVSWNKAAERIYGIRSEEAIGKHIESLITTRYNKGTTGEIIFADLAETGFWRGDLYQTGANGNEIKVLSSVVLIRNKFGEMTDIVAVNRDMTEYLQFERENRLLANVFKKSKTALAVSDHKTGELLRVNDAYAELFGYEPGEMIGLDVNENLYPESEKTHQPGRVEELDKHGYLSFESKLKRKDGSEFYGILNLSILSEPEQDEAYRISTIQDISNLKAVQSQISSERQRFELAANTVSDVVWEWNPVEQLLWWGEGLESVMGYSKDEYRGQNHFWREHIHEEDREFVLKSMNDAETGDQTEWQCEYRFIAADGGIRMVRDSAVLIRNEDGELNRIIGAMVDVTRIREYQEALDREKNRFELIARSANDVLYERSLNSNEIWWSEGWVHHFEYDEQDVNSTVDWWMEKIHPEDRKMVMAGFNRAISRNDDSWSGKYRFQNGRGEYWIVEDKGYFVKDEEGKRVQLVGAISNITSDELAQIELRKSEEQYRLLFERSPIAMYIYHPDTLHIITVNQAAIDRYGYSETEFRDMRIYDLHPEDEHDAVMAEIRKSLKKKSTGFDVWNQVTKSGERLIVEISGSQIMYGDEVMRLIIANDVTQQRLAERQLKVSEEQYRLLFEMNPIPMWIYDPETYGFSASNKASRDKYGYSDDEFRSMTIFDLHKSEELDDVKHISEKNRSSDAIAFVEGKHLTKDRKQLIVEISASDIQYKEKKQRLVIANDITEQRKAEERAISAILEGEERERQRIAKELHDGLGQYLSAANMNLETVFEDAPGLPVKLSETFNNGLELLNYAISETRNISQNLLPKAIQDYGLELALQALINQLKGHNDIKFFLYQKLDNV